MGEDVGQEKTLTLTLTFTPQHLEEILEENWIASNVFVSVGDDTLRR